MSEQKIDMLLNALSEFRSDFDTFKNENKEQFTEVREQLERIEKTTLRLEAEQPKDISAMLNQINKKLDQRDNELQVLNKRLFRAESEVEKMAQQ